MSTFKALGYLILVLSFTACFDCQKFFSNEFKPDYMNGVIIKKYRDTNHDMPILDIKQLKNKEIRIFMILEFPKSFWERAQIGDTIRKEKGTTEVKLIKHDSTFSYYPECNGQQVR